MTGALAKPIEELLPWEVEKPEPIDKAALARAFLDHNFAETPIGQAALQLATAFAGGVPPPKDTPEHDIYTGLMRTEGPKIARRLQAEGENKAGAARFTPLGTFLAEVDPPQEWLVPDLIALDTLTQFLGKPESFKTFGLLNLHIAATYGTEWLGRPVPAVHGYYVSGEKRRRSVRERLAVMTQQQKTRATKELTIIHRTGLKVDPTNEQWLRLVEEVSKRQERTLVSLDTLTTLAPSDFNENRGESWAPMLEAMRMLTDLPEPATVLASFHPAKHDKGGVGMSSRGHGSFDGEADGAIVFNRPTRATDEGSIHARPKDGAYTVIPFAWNPKTYALDPVNMLTMPLTNATIVDVVAALERTDFESIWNAFGLDATGKHRFGVRKVREVLNAAVEAGDIDTERNKANENITYFIPGEEAEE